MGSNYHTHSHSHYHKVDVNEHRAPTDESMRLVEEMHDKVIKNIIAQVDVSNNIVSGTAWMMQNHLFDTIELVFKFQINGKEYTFRRKLNQGDLLRNYKEISEVERFLKEKGSAVLLWYVLRHLQMSFYEEITGEKAPEQFYS